MKPIFILMVQLTNKTFGIGLQKILVNCIRYHYTVQKLLCGVVWESAGYLVHSFFEEEDTATVTSDRYIRMFENYFLPELRRRGINTASMWFQQDGATAHTARASMTAVRAAFPNHVISRFGDLPWPPRSPDLSMCDFYLWGFLKLRVYAAKPRTLEELKTATRENIQEIGEEKP